MTHEASVPCLQVAIIFSEDYSIQFLKDAFIARANAPVNFYTVSLSAMSARDAISVTRSHNKALKMEEECGFVAVVVATNNKGDRNTISIALRRDPGTMSILFPESLGASRRPEPMDDRLLSEIQAIRSDVGLLNLTVAAMKEKQAVQGKAIEVITEEIDDLCDNDRVFRSDIYTRLNENSAALRDATGGNLTPPDNPSFWQGVIGRTLGWRAVAAIGSIGLTLVLTVLSHLEVEVDPSGKTKVRLRPIDEPPTLLMPE